VATALSFGILFCHRGPPLTLPLLGFDPPVAWVFRPVALLSCRTPIHIVLGAGTFPLASRPLIRLLTALRFLARPASILLCLSLPSPHELFFVCITVPPYLLAPLLALGRWPPFSASPGSPAFFTAAWDPCSPPRPQPFVTFLPVPHTPFPVRPSLVSCCRASVFPAGRSPFLSLSLRRSPLPFPSCGPLRVHPPVSRRPCSPLPLPPSLSASRPLTWALLTDDHLPFHLSPLLSLFSFPFLPAAPPRCVFSTFGSSLASFLHRSLFQLSHLFLLFPLSLSRGAPGFSLPPSALGAAMAFAASSGALLRPLAPGQFGPPRPVVWPRILHHCLAVRVGLPPALLRQLLAFTPLLTWPDFDCPEFRRWCGIAGSGRLDFYIFLAYLTTPWFCSSAFRLLLFFGLDLCVLPLTRPHLRVSPFSLPHIPWFGGFPSAGGVPSSPACSLLRLRPRLSRPPLPRFLARSLAQRFPFLFALRPPPIPSGLPFGPPYARPGPSFLGVTSVPLLPPPVAPLPSFLSSPVRFAPAIWHFFVLPPFGFGRPACRLLPLPDRTPRPLALSPWLGLAAGPPTPTVP